MARRVVNIAVFCCLLTASVRGSAEGLNPSDFSPDAVSPPVVVVQNRFFQKSGRFSGGLFLGTLIDEAYVDTRLFGVRSGWFLNEWVGFEGGYWRSEVSDSEDRKTLRRMRYREIQSERIVFPDPKVNAISGVAEINVAFVPFYGKLNILDQLIIYSDLQAVVGYSQITTARGISGAGVGGLEERFYLGQHFAMQAGLVVRSFYDDFVTPQKKLRHAYMLEIGANFFL